VKKDKNRIISVIDIGTSKVVTLIAELTHPGSVTLRGVGVAPTEGVKKGIVVNMDDVTKAIFQSVNAAEEKAGNHVLVSAVVGITGDHVAANTSRGFTKIADPSRGVTVDDINKAVESARRLLLPPDKQIIGVVEHDFTVDGHSGIRSPEGMSGNRLEVEVQIITGAISFVQNLSRCISNLNIVIDSFELSPLASGESVLNDDEKDVGTVLIDFGAGTTEVGVFKNHKLKKARVFPVGSRHIDNDIAVVLGTSAREAERIKLEYGMAYVDETVGSDPVEIEHVGGEKKTQIPRGHLCEIIHERVYELFKMVGHDLETDMPMSIIPTGVVLTGGGSLLPGMTRVAEQVLGMNVRVGRPSYEGEMADLVAGPEFATSVGLLRLAAKNAEHKIGGGGGGSFPQHMFRTAAGFLRGLFK
jgi:cell division protein FtsA